MQPVKSLRLLPLAIALLAATPLLHAEMRTLTDTQGRTLQAELVSVDGDNVTIKRSDGETFTIPLATLSAGDQQDIKAWAAKQAARLPAGSIKVQISRTVFDSKKQSTGKGYTVTLEHLGYGVTLQNRSGKTVTGLRMDCILFVKPGKNPGQTTSAPLRELASSRKLDAIAPFDTANFHTNSIAAERVDLDPGFIWTKGGSLPVVDELYGAWLRFYLGDQLVAEVCSPEDLSTTQKWINPK